jgi:hypothetical protein
MEMLEHHEGRLEEGTVMGRNGSMVSGIGMTVLTMLLVASCSTGTEPNPPSSTEAEGSQAPQIHVFVASDCPELTCQGSLQPGTYRSTILEPAFSFEITSSGWTWDYSAGSFRILADPSHEDLYSPDGIYFLREPAIASQDCEETEEPGVGRSVRDLVAWLEAAPGLSITAPTPVTIGGLDGVQLDLELDPKWSRTCFWSERMPAVPLIFRGTDIGGYNWAMLPDMSMRWYVLGSADGVIVVDIEDGPGGLSHTDLLGTGTEIVDSLAFSPPS